MADFKLTKDASTAVSLSTYYKPIDDKTPVGVKLIVINRARGVAVMSEYQRGSEWTHWAPLPRFKD